MPKLPMDLSKFAKISATDKKTTLKHKDGHFMVIAHGALKPELRKVLEGLPFAKGGKVNKEPKENRQGLSKKEANRINRNMTLRSAGHDAPAPPAYRCEACNSALDAEDVPYHKCDHPDGFANGGTVPEPDPKKAKEMQAGATQSGWQPKQWAQNVKEGLGFGYGTEEPIRVREEDVRTGGKSTIGPPEPTLKDVEGNLERTWQVMHRDFKRAAEHPEHPETPEYHSKGGKVERARIFGERGNPGKNSEKGKAQMVALIKTAAKRYGLDVVPSKGKIEESGERRDFDPKQVGGKLKPDWRSNELESQMNPQAISHEMAHLEISDEGKRLPTLQKEMDEQYAETASEFGGRQKQTQGEIQPMAMENPLRRRAGVPAFARPQYTDPRMGKSKETLSEESPDRKALDTGEKYAVRLQDPETGEMYDLIGLSKNASAPNMERLQAVDEGSMKFGKGKGWHKTSNPDALINLRGRGQHEEAAERARHMGIQKGSKKPSRLYARGTEEPIEPLEVERIDGLQPEPLDIEPLDIEPVDPNSPEAAAPPTATKLLRPDQQPTQLPGDAPLSADAPAPMPTGPQQDPAAAMAPQGPAKADLSKETFPTETSVGEPVVSAADEVLQERNNTAQDLMEGQIHPKTYGDLFASKDTLGKIGTMFGLLLGGAGSGLTGQPNALLKMMDKTIERDLDAQKTSAANRQNFYKIRQQQVMNEAIVKRYAAENGLTRAQAKEVLAKAGMADLELGQAKQVLGDMGGGLTPAENVKVDTLTTMDGQLSALHQLDSRVQGMPESPQKQNAVSALQWMANEVINKDHPARAQRVGQAHDAEAQAKEQASAASMPGSTILAPNYRKRAMQLAYHPVAKHQMGEITKQIGDAEQAEKAMAEVNKVFPQLQNEADIRGRIMRGGQGVGGALGAALGSIGGAKGAAIGASLGHGIPRVIGIGDEQIKNYEAHKSGLVKIIKTLVPSLTTEAVEDMVDKTAPEQGDEPKTLDNKREVFLDLIRNSVTTNLLEQYGLSPPRRR